MSTPIIIELKKLDPEDIGDVLRKVEKSFGFRFGATELKDIKTFGELCDIIVSKVQGDNVSDCTTQQAFYKVRNAVADTLLIGKSNITHDTNLDILFPRQRRRQKVKEVKIKSDIHFEILETKEWIRWIYFLGIIMSMTVFLFKWQYALLGVTFFTVFGLTMHQFFATEFKYQTVAELAEKFTRESYLKARRDPSTINRKEITEKVKELFKEYLFLEETGLTREATFE